MLPPWLTCLPALGRGLFLAAQLLTGLQLGLSTAGVVWRGLRTLTHHRLQHLKSRIPGTARRGRRNRKKVKISGTSRSKISLRTIWKNKSSASKRRRLKLSKDTSVGMLHLGPTAQPQSLKPTRKHSDSTDDLNFSGLAEVTMMPDHDLLEGDMLLDLLKRQGPLPALAIVRKMCKEQMFYSVVLKTSLTRLQHLQDCCIESSPISRYQSWILKTEAESDFEDVEDTDVTRSWEEEYDRLVSWRRKNSLGDEDEATEDRTTCEEKLGPDVEMIDCSLSLETQKHLAILDQWGPGRWHQVSSKAEASFLSWALEKGLSLYD